MTQLIPAPPSQNEYQPSPQQQSIEQQLLVRCMLLLGFALQVITIETGMSQKRIRLMRKDLIDNGYYVSLSRRTYRSTQTILEDHAGKLHASLFLEIYKNLGEITSPGEGVGVGSSINIDALLRAYRLYYVVLQEIPPSPSMALDKSLNVNDAWLLAREYRSGERLPDLWHSLESELEAITSQGSLIEIEEADEEPIAPFPQRSQFSPPTQHRFDQTAKQQNLLQQLTARFLLLAGFITQVVTIESGLSQKQIRSMRQELAQGKYKVRLNRRTCRTSRTIIESQAGKLHASLFMTIYSNLGRLDEIAGAPSITTSINIDVLLKAYGLYSVLLQEMPETNLVSWGNWLSISDAWSLARELRATEASIFTCGTCKTGYFESVNQDTLIDCPYCMGLLPSSSRVLESVDIDEEVA